LAELKDSKTEISPFAHGVYLEAISKAREFKAELTKAEKNEKTESTEETKEDQSVPKVAQVEKCVVFILSTKCKNCSEILYAEDIINGWKRSANDYITQCPSCTQSFTAEYFIL